MPAGDKIHISTPIEPVFPFSERQLEHRNKIHEAILTGELCFKQSACVCGQTEVREVVTYDAWGFNLPTVECVHCHTLRSEYFMDDESLKKFYKERYYFAHMFTNTTNVLGVGMDPVAYIQEERKKGDGILRWIRSVYPGYKEFKMAVEIGCGAGGILQTFSALGIRTVGSDWNEEYIKAGCEQTGQDLRVGGIEVLAGEKADLIILSDLVEHLTEPISFLGDINKILSTSGIVYVNVPGVFGINRVRFGCSFRQFTKIEHTWCHTLQSLIYLFDKVGYRYLIGDEGIRALFSNKISISSRHSFPKTYVPVLRSFLHTLPLRKKSAFFDFVWRKIIGILLRWWNWRLKTV